MSLTNLKKYIIPLVIGLAFVIIILGTLFTRENSPLSIQRDTSESEIIEDTNFGSTDTGIYPIPTQFESAGEVVPNDDYTEGVLVGNPDIPSSQASQFVQNSEYVIQYTPSSDSFLIVINSSPFNEQRAKAENEFLDTLNISRQEACTLDVSITTPQWANPNETGTIHRLSFCTGI